MFAYETERAPLYVLRFVGRFTAADERVYLAALEDLLHRPPGFALVVVLQNENRMSADGNKQQALWFKQNRNRLGEICQGMVRVREHEPDHHHDTSNFRKAMPFPTTEVETEAEGIAWALARLEEAGR